eukprot:TRINITY_DN11165_c0_g3_i2.p1 TRINITY_DN11165_c0_g3~~TRINITY_DN11165_c0_g3_i2.p1  ORF type:complete len:306 (-),score=68.33 TRINITY_DN11165_c0_g3_i2:125-1042(-)
MRDYFEYYGEVTNSTLMLDFKTGKFRGFGFVTFKDPGVVRKVLEERSHVLDGRLIDCKEAIPKSVSTYSKPANSFHTRKIFVGGLPHELPEKAFTKYFAKYGTVVHGLIMRDRDSGKSRGFGFVTFDSEEAVKKVLKNIRSHKLMGKWVECKRATFSTRYSPGLGYKKSDKEFYSPCYKKSGDKDDLQGDEGKGSELYEEHRSADCRARSKSSQAGEEFEIREPVEERKQGDDELILSEIDYSKGFCQSPTYSGFFTNLEAAGHLHPESSDSLLRKEAANSIEVKIKIISEDNEKDLFSNIFELQ